MIFARGYAISALNFEEVLPMNLYDPQLMKDVVAGFVRFIDRRHRNNEIYDASILPWPKEMIKEICTHRLETESNPHIRRTIADSLLCLAFYQEGIGIEAMQQCRLDLFTMDIASLSEDKLKRLRLTVAEHLPHLDCAKFLTILRLVQAEFKSLDTLCETMEKQHGTDTFTPDLTDTSASATILKEYANRRTPATRQ